jgi:hypothetical protein
VKRICDHWSTDNPRLYFKPLRESFVGICRHPLLHFEPSHLLNFVFDPDPDPYDRWDPGPATAFHSDVDPDPASRNYADPGP